MKLMSLDIVDLREFYRNPLGQTVRHLLRTRVRRIWPDVKGETLLALGYGTPLLRPWLEEAHTVLAMTHKTMGVAYWPREGPNRACLTDLTNLPLPNESVDRVILLHALEAESDPDALLREVWRVLKGHGRALLIVPNRRGLWAHSDRTPFGTGRPYSAFQLRDTLRDHGFLVDRTWRSLYLPPLQARPVLAAADVLEKGLGWLLPGFGGLLVMEAGKQIYAPLLTKARNFKHRLVLPLPFPVPSGPMPTGRDLHDAP